MRPVLCAVLVTSILSQSPVVVGQLPTGWRAHDKSRPLPNVVDPGESKLPASIPSDAVVLFDGSDLSEWTDGKGNPAKWKIVDEAMESVPGSGYVHTTKKFGDCQLHVEWATPAKVKGDGQGRGNSGVYLMGDFEIQVLDSYENETYADGSAGAVYGQYPPLVNASRKPGQWQSYDIVFRRPRFDESGKLSEPARVTVFHNGLLIQNNSEIIGPTSWIKFKPYQPKKTEGPLSLQDHGNPVRYRNIWIRPLEERVRPEKPYETENNSVEISDQAKQAVVGNYGGFRIEDKDGTLLLHGKGTTLEMLPLSETRFEFLSSAGNIQFEKDDSGNIVSAKLRLDAAGITKGTKKM